MEHFNQQNDSIDTFFNVITILNALRGFFFFLIFICKKSVILKLKRHLTTSRRRRSIQTRANISSQVTPIKVIIMCNIFS